MNLKLTARQQETLLKLLLVALPVVGEFLEEEEIEALETIKEELERDTD